MEKEKIVDVELRKADAAKRQTDIAEMIMNFVASEVAKNSGNGWGKNAQVLITVI